MLKFRRVAPVAVVLAGLSLASAALGQITASSVERSVSTFSELGNGASDGNGDGSSLAGAFDRSLSTILPGPGGAGADSFATQQSMVSPATVWGTLSAANSVKTGSTFVTGQGQGMSSFLLLFNLAAPTAVTFTASGSIVLNGVNPDGEPSDLYGRAYVRLINADTEEEISGFTLFPTAGTGSDSFDGTLPAGSYALLAQAFSFGFSADLLGPPARSGNGNSQVQFNLSVASPPACGTSDFNGDGDFGTDADIEAFFACLGGSCCATCFEGGSDFNRDGDFGTDADIESFFRVLGGAQC
jgi:hypothetical protein